MAATEATPIKLPVWRSVREAYGLVFRNFGFLLRVGWPWLLLIALALTALRDVISRLGLGAVDGESTSLLETNTSVFITTLCLAVPSVRLTRHILDRVPESETSLGFRQTCVVYSIASLALIVGTFGPATVVSLFASPNDDTGWIEFLAMLGALFLGVVVLVRLPLLLPAIAVDAADAALAMSWNATNRNGFRVGLALATVILPALALVYVKDIVVAGLSLESTSIRLLALAAYDVADALISFLGIALGCIAYRELVMKKAAG